MSNTKKVSETGHAKNVANFESLISFCIGYGADYNPSNENLKLPALNTLFNSANAALLEVKSTKTIFDNATNAREIGFEPFKKFSTRIINALAATDAAKQTINDAKTINRKIQGKRADNSPLPAKKVAKSDLSADINVKDVEDKQISVSQQGIDNMLDHFSKIIQLVSAEPLYLPNETDLKVEELKTLLINLKTSNSKAIAAATAYSNARIARNVVLYALNTGLVETALGVKKYVKSVFGVSVPKYKQISRLKFKNIPA